MCPKEDCPDKTSLKEGDTCPTCGAEAKNFGFFDLKLHLEVKNNLQGHRPPEAQQQSGVGLPFGRTEGGRPPGAPELQTSASVAKGRSLENNLTEPASLNLLKEIFEQNKTIIQQNEHIVKLLTKN